jgi:hypothetical protein
MVDYVGKNICPLEYLSLGNPLMGWSFGADIPIRTATYDRYYNLVS